MIAYLFLLGWIISLILNNAKHTSLGSFHVRQSFGIMCVATIVFILVSLLNISIPSILNILTMIVLWLLGFISALQGEIQPVPVLGAYFQKWFNGI